MDRRSGCHEDQVDICNQIRDLRKIFTHEVSHKIYGIGTGISIPISSMYGIFTYVWLFLTVKYGKCR